MVLMSPKRLPRPWASSALEPASAGSASPVASLRPLPRAAPISSRREDFRAPENTFMETSERESIGKLKNERVETKSRFG